MSAPLRLIGFALVLVLIGGAAYGLGRSTTSRESDASTDYRLELAQDVVQKAASPGPRTGATTLRFTIRDADGRVQRDFDIAHEKRLHLIVIDQTQTQFHHLHPEMTATGEWTARARLAPQRYRVYADFRVGGVARVAEASLQVGTTTAEAPAASAGRVSNVGPYTVTLAGSAVAGQRSELGFVITRRGQAITDLEPYLGASAHLVAVRSGVGTYLHTHPEGSSAGPEVRFGVRFDEAAEYVLFVEFRHRGVVHAARFTVTASEAGHEREVPHGDH